MPVLIVMGNDMGETKNCDKHIKAIIPDKGVKVAISIPLLVIKMILFSFFVI